MVQWLRFHTLNAGVPGSIPGRGTRSHTLVSTKSSHATSKDPACHSKDGRCYVLQLRPSAAR